MSRRSKRRSFRRRFLAFYWMRVNLRAAEHYGRAVVACEQVIAANPLPSSDHPAASAMHAMLLGYTATALTDARAKALYFTARALMPWPGR